MIYEKEGGPAQPVDFYVDGTRKVYVGMSLRDWFAGQALAGICASIDSGDLDCHYKTVAGSLGDNGITYPSSITEHAYAIADAMLKARER